MKIGERAKSYNQKKEQEKREKEARRESREKVDVKHLNSHHYVKCSSFLIYTVRFQGFVKERCIGD